VRLGGDPKVSLLRLLRDDLHLCGTKEGCSTGDCGSYAVLIDDKPEKAAPGAQMECVSRLEWQPCRRPLRQSVLNIVAKRAWSRMPCSVVRPERIMGSVQRNRLCARLEGML
jgi:hypothetical protein